MKKGRGKPAALFLNLKTNALPKLLLDLEQPI